LWFLPPESHIKRNKLVEVSGEVKGGCTLVQGDAAFTQREAEEGLLHPEGEREKGSLSFCRCCGFAGGSLRAEVGRQYNRDPSHSIELSDSMFLFLWSVLFRLLCRDIDAPPKP